MGTPSEAHYGTLNKMVTATPFDKVTEPEVVIFTDIRSDWLTARLADVDAEHFEGEFIVAEMPVDVGVTPQSVLLNISAVIVELGA